MNEQEIWPTRIQQRTLNFYLQKESGPLASHK